MFVDLELNKLTNDIENWVLFYICDTCAEGGGVGGGDGGGGEPAGPGHRSGRPHHLHHQETRWKTVLGTTFI